MVRIKSKPNKVSPEYNKPVCPPSYVLDSSNPEIWKKRKQSTSSAVNLTQESDGASSAKKSRKTPVTTEEKCPSFEYCGTCLQAEVKEIEKILKINFLGTTDKGVLEQDISYFVTQYREYADKRNKLVKQKTRHDWRVYKFDEEDLQVLLTQYAEQEKTLYIQIVSDHLLSYIPGKIREIKQDAQEQGWNINVEQKTTQGKLTKKECEIKTWQKEMERSAANSSIFSQEPNTPTNNLTESQILEEVLSLRKIFEEEGKLIPTVLS